MKNRTNKAAHEEPANAPGKRARTSRKGAGPDWIERTDSNQGMHMRSHWNRGVQDHRLLAEWWYFAPREGITVQDLMDFALHGDLVAQAYLGGLHKAVPLLRASEPSLVPNYFERLLLSHVRRLNEMLCELANAGRWAACRELWDQALKLSETFSELALKYPDPFRSVARRSLFMQSLRTRNPDFTADAEAIAAAIELSAESVGDKLTDNRVRLGALCARLVAECVDEIMRARNLWSDMFARRQETVVWPTAERIEPLVAKSIQEVRAGAMEACKSGRSESKMELRLSLFCHFQDCGPQRLHFLVLPELSRQTAPLWWKDAVEKMIEERFPRLVENPTWLALLKAVSTGTRSDMLKELKDYSRDKVRQFAPAGSRP